MQGGTKYYFFVFDMTRPGIEAQSHGAFANTNNNPNRPV